MPCESIATSLCRSHRLAWRLACAVAALVLLGVAARSHAADSQALAPPNTPGAPPVEAQADHAVAPGGRDARGLGSEAVYSVLVGEIAGRRGVLGTAYTHYLRAAELTRSPVMAELAVRAAISAEDAAAADRAIRLWLVIAPQSRQVHRVAAYLRIKADDRNGAMIHLAEVVRNPEADAASRFAPAVGVISRIPDPQRRISYMETLIGMFPESADAQQSLALVAASVDRYELAERAARRALELAPGWNVPRLFLVRLKLSANRREEARQLLETYVKEAPDDHAISMLYGEFLVEQRQFKPARDVFERLLLADPKAPDALFAAGILSLQLEDFSGALEHFTRLYESGQRSDAAAFYLGQTEEQLAHTDKAVEWYSKVNGENEVDALVRLALLQARAGQVDQAREILQQLRGQHPDDAVTFYLIEADLLDQIGDDREVMGVYSEALSLYPGDESLLYARGLYAAGRGDLAVAEADLRAMIAADSDNADALNALGYTLADQTDRHAEARELIERAHALKPDEPAILDSMGWVQYRLGHYQQALEYLRQAAVSVEDGEIGAHLGEVLWALGQPAQARMVWCDAGRQFPDHVYLRKTLTRHGIDPARGDCANARRMPAMPAERAEGSRP